MIQIDNTLISLDLIEKKFVCDLSKCHGACCIEGDAGAPLEEKEIKILKKNYPDIKKYISPKGKKAIEKKGLYVMDEENEAVTSLINNRECAYSVYENNILRCGIEKAWKAGKTSLQKPISCFLYPVRVMKYQKYLAVNYHKWDICDAARALGQKKGIPLYVFLKQALIARFGKEWYNKLKEAVRELKQQNMI